MRYALLLTCLLLALPARAQFNTNTYGGLTARVMALDHGLTDDKSGDLSQTFALELGYHRQLGKSLSLYLPARIGLIDIGERENPNIYGVDAILRLYPIGVHRGLAPYVQGGYGIVRESGGTLNRQIPVGAGFNIRLSPQSWLSLQGEYRRSDLDLRDHVTAGVGFTYRVSGRDTDKDGTPDRVDACPTASGPVASGGCPDTDGDSLLDKDDRCPYAAGLVAQRGCPDTDRDGVVDLDDKCPDVAGLVSVKGCLDADGDGVADPDDNCPRDPGPATTQGCPDGDGDGLIDKNDDCPGKAGPARFRGCPDRDGDGLPDDADRCPDLPGNLITGCPDQDDDGFNDDVDRCPKQAGPLEGCPDTDGDGIADKDDHCPRKAGPLFNGGCPR